MRQRTDGVARHNRSLSLAEIHLAHWLNYRVHLPVPEDYPYERDAERALELHRLIDRDLAAGVDPHAIRSHAERWHRGEHERRALDFLLTAEPEPVWYETPWGRARPLSMAEMHDRSRTGLTPAELCVVYCDEAEAAGAGPELAMRMAVTKVEAQLAERR